MDELILVYAGAAIAISVGLFAYLLWTGGDNG